MLILAMVMSLFSERMAVLARRADGTKAVVLTEERSSNDAMEDLDTFILFVLCVKCCVSIVC